MSAVASAGDFATTAEKTSYKETGRYAEAVSLCDGIARANPGRAKCLRWGKTPEGRELVALALGSRRDPVVLIQGGIHPGESDGKDAGFAVARELLSTPGALKGVCVLFVPVFNVDGHERFGAYNRPNQNGPAETGWRVTARQLNLNRDYLKADSPEMQAMLRLLREWDPIALADLHVTDGVDFQNDISIIAQPRADGLQGDAGLGAKAVEARTAMLGALREKGYVTLDFYPSLVDDHDPGKGFEASLSGPRFSEAYWALRNRIGILVETHSWKPYERRVRATETAVRALLAAARAHGREWRKEAAAADARGAKLAGTELGAGFETGDAGHVIEMPGYEYELVDSKVSGQKRVIYHPEKKQLWKVPFHDKIEPKAQLLVPAGGWVVPPAHADWLAEKLRLHGIRFERVRAAKPGAGTRPEAPAEVWRATDIAFRATSYEGRQLLQAKGAWVSEPRAVAAGSLYVPSAQPLARVAAHLLDPQSPDSLAAWGFFNAHFERREYMEDYVAESVAETMLKDPKVRAEFDARVANDAEFAKSPAKRLEFFYRKHPSWDSRYGLYPVFRVSAKP